MSIIDSTYFQGAIDVPFKSGEANDFTTLYIDRYENEYLYKLLGMSFALEFIAGLEESSIPEKWEWLRDGKEYTVSDRTYKWEGLSNTIKKSPIANYVYIQYQLATGYTTTTRVGEARNNAQNATISNPTGKVSRAHSDMLTMHRALYHFLTHNSSTYDAFKFGDVADFGCINGLNI